MGFLKALFKIIFFPIKLVLKLVWKFLKWIVLSPFRLVLNLAIIAGIIAVLFIFVF